MLSFLCLSGAIQSLQRLHQCLATLLLKTNWDLQMDWEFGRNGEPETKISREFILEQTHHNN